MKWIKDCGREYTIALSATYTVQVDNDWDMCEAESLAWNLLEQAYQNSDVNEFEIYETLDIRAGWGSYFVKVKVNSVIYAIGHDITAAYNEAVDLIENIKMPDDGIELDYTEQTDLIEVGDRVQMVVGE